MKTKVEVSIQMESDGIKFGYWKGGNFIEVDGTKNEVIDTAAKALGCSRELVDAIAVSVSTLSEAVKMDLLDIWNRLDQLEKQLTKSN